MNSPQNKKPILLNAADPNIRLQALDKITNNDIDEDLKIKLRRRLDIEDDQDVLIRLLLLISSIYRNSRNQTLNGEIQLAARRLQPLRSGTVEALEDALLRINFNLSGAEIIGYLYRQGMKC